MLGRSLAALAVLVLVVGGTVSVPSAGALGRAASSSVAATSGSIVLAATEDYGYQPDTFQQIPTDANITVTFTDQSVLQHSFTITSREGFVIPIGYTPSQLTAFLAAYPPLFSLLVNGSGEVATGHFTSPATPGWYEFVCNVSGHFENGMYGFLAFGENLPSNLTRSPRTGLGLSNLSPLDGAAIAGLFAAFLLAVALWWRHRSRPRERPEPHRDPHAPR
jgi:plastocyanin